MEDTKRGTLLTMPELGLIAGTRALTGAGVAFLLADRLTVDQRKAIGWTLFLVGAIISIPLAFQVFGSRRSFREEETLRGQQLKTAA